MKQIKHTGSILHKILQEITIIDQQLASESVTEKALLLVGETKVGKTTLLYHLSGKPLKHRKNQLDVDVLESETLMGQAIIGNDFNSTTMYPNFIQAGQDCPTIIDMPGYSDTQADALLLKLYIFFKTMSLIDSVHICYVLSSQLLGSNELLKQFEKLITFLNPELLASDKCLSFVLTKIEDEDILDIFEESLEEIKEEHEGQLMEGQINGFHAKNKYVFRNCEPEAGEGLQLREDIEQNNHFFAVGKQAFSLLGGSFWRDVIGELQQEDFIGFLDQVLGEFVECAVAMVKLTVAIVFLEYSDVISFLHSQNKESFELEMLSTIEALQQQNSLNNLPPLAWKQQTQTSSKSPSTNIEQILNIFTRIEEESTSDDYLPSNLKKLSSIFQKDAETESKGQTKIDVDFSQAISTHFIALFNLLLILRQIKEPQIERRVEEVLQSQELRSVIEELYSVWEANHNKLTEHPAFSAYFGQNQVKYRTVKIKTYSEIKNAGIKEAARKLGKVKDKGKEESAFIVNQAVSRMPITEDSIELLGEDYQGMERLLDTLGDSSLPIQNSPLNQAILTKVMTIFARFSLFEQALVFAITLNHEATFSQLLEESLLSGQIEPEFICSILLPYLTLVQPPTPISKIKITLCQDYLFALADQLSESQFLQLQWIGLRQVNDLKQNIDYPSSCCPQPGESLCLHYIHPILEDPRFYVELVQRQEELFVTAPVYRLWQTEVFMELMQ